MPQESDWREFTKWWAESERQFLRVGRHYGASEDESRDVVQDLAVLAIQNYARFSEKAEFNRWAFARLHWLILDRFRVAKRLSYDVTESLVPPIQPRQEIEVFTEEILAFIRKLPM